MPPLRERAEDIPALAGHFLAQSARRCKKAVRGFAPAALQALVPLCRGPATCASWRTSIERAVIVAASDMIADVEPLPGRARRRTPRVDLTLPFRDAKARVVEEFERAYVAGVLEAHGGKLTAAAKHADMDPKNFWEKLIRYGLRRAAAPPDEGRSADPTAS